MVMYSSSLTVTTCRSSSSSDAPLPRTRILNCVGGKLAPTNKEQSSSSSSTAAIAATVDETRGFFKVMLSEVTL